MSKLRLMKALAVWLLAAMPAFAVTTFTNLGVSGMGASSVTITFKTSGSISTQVNYGINNVINATAPDAPSTTHTFTIKGLDPGNVYSYQAMASDTSTSATQQFSLCDSSTNKASLQAKINNYYAYGRYTITFSDTNSVGVSPSLCGAAITSPLSGSMDYLGSLAADVAQNLKTVPSPSSWTVAAADVGNLAPISASATVGVGSADISAALQAAATGQLQFVWYNPSTSTFYPTLSATGGVTSINGDTTHAQTIAAATGISVATAAGTTTVTNTSPGAPSAGASTAVQSSNGTGGFNDSGCTATGASITCSNGVSGGPVAALATYGACNSGATAYKFAGINDGSTNVIGATVSGGGSINESVFCNTTAWTCAAGCTAPSGSFTAAGDLSGNATSQNVINAHWTVHATVTTTPYTVAAADYEIPCDATSGTIVLNLPAATGSGKEYAFKKLDASANACAITPNGTNTIDAVNAAQNITTQYANLVLIDSASGKWIIKNVQQLAGAITGTSNNNAIAVGTLPNGMTATTQTLGDNTTNVATDAFVIANIPGTAIYNTPVTVTELATTGAVGSPITILDGSTNTTNQVLQFSFTAAMSSTSVFTSCTSTGKITLYVEGTDADSGYVFGAIGGSGALTEAISTGVNFFGGAPTTFGAAVECQFGNALNALAAKCIGLPMTMTFKANTAAKLFFNEVIARAAGCTGIVDVFYPTVTRIR